MKKYSIAFVGCGGIGDHYLELYRDLDFLEVAVCIDVDLERARRASAALGNGALASADFAEALGAGVDGVLINTPNHLHREQAIAALKAGKHLLLQKPVAASVADAEAISTAASEAKRGGVVSGLYLSYFDQPLMHDLRSMIELGWFGRITHLYARLMHRGGIALSRQLQAGEKNWRASASQTGGGCFIQLAVHYVHLFKWMMGAKVARVSAMTKHLACPGVEGEDLACALLEYSNGAVATMDMAWNTAGEQLSVHGTKGTCEYIGNRTLLLDSSAGTFEGEVIRYEGASGQLSPGAPGSAPTNQAMNVIAPSLGDVNNPFNQHRMFWEAVRDGREPFVSIESGVDDLRVVEAVYRSATTGRVVELS